MSGNPELLSVVPTGQDQQQCSHKHCNKGIWIHKQFMFQHIPVSLQVSSELKQKRFDIIVQEEPKLQYDLFCGF